MQLLSTQPGIRVDDVVENTGFELLISDDVSENPAPTKDELRILRNDVDRTKFYI
jgi:glutaconate CoA-transferase subunit B